MSYKVVQINESQFNDVLQFSQPKMATKQVWEHYRYEGDVIAGLHAPGDFIVILPLPSEIDELEAASDCLFSRQNSSIFTSAIPF